MAQKATLIKWDAPAETVVSHGAKFSLAELQGFVGGYIELVSTRSPVRDMYVNEDAIQKGLPANMQATAWINPKWNIPGAILGNAVIIHHVKDSEGLFKGWPKD